MYEWRSNTVIHRVTSRIRPRKRVVNRNLLYLKGVLINFVFVCLGGTFASLYVWYEWLPNFSREFSQWILELQSFCSTTFELFSLSTDFEVFFLIILTKNNWEIAGVQHTINNPSQLRLRQGIIHEENHQLNYAWDSYCIRERIQLCAMNIISCSPHLAPRATVSA